MLANLHNVSMLNMLDEGGPDDALPLDNEVLSLDDNSETEESNAQLNNDDVDITDEVRELPHLPDEDGQATPDGRECNPQGWLSRAPEPDTVTNGDWDIEEYPIATAGTPLGATRHSTTYETNELCAPFQSKLDWELAHWAKCETISSSAVTWLLSISGVSDILCHIETLTNRNVQITETLSLSYKNVQELNLLIDHNIHGHCPSFKTHDITVGNEVITLHACNILDCVKALYGDPEFAVFLKFKLECHYQVGAGHAKSCVHHDMHMVDWWWEVQVCTA